MPREPKTREKTVMPEFKMSLDEDPKLADRLKMYRDALDSAPDFAPPADPRENPVPDVEYEDDGFPAMPEDMTALSSRQLGQLFQAIEAWHEFLNSMLAEYDTKASTLREIKDLAAAHIKDELKDAGVSQKERDVEYKLDARYVQANSDYLAARNFKERLEAVKNQQGL
jgi:hypothetical protein